MYIKKDNATPEHAMISQRMLCRITTAIRAMYTACIISKYELKKINISSL